MKLCLDSYWTLVGLIHQLSVTTVKAFDDFIGDVKADVFYRGFSCIRHSASACCFSDTSQRVAIRFVHLNHLRA